MQLDLPLQVQAAAGGAVQSKGSRQEAMKFSLVPPLNLHVHSGR